MIESSFYAAEKHQLNAGLYMYQFATDAMNGLTNPVIQIDYFYMAHPYFKPHPHSGFSAVTYMLERSEGGFINRDSLGDRSEIRPGDLHWTWAASGMMHEEVPKVPGIVCNGLQIFMNMPEKERCGKARAFHLNKESMPVVEESGARVKVVSGNYQNAVSPLPLPTPISLLDVSLRAKGSLEVPLRKDRGGILLVTSGSANLLGKAAKAHQSIGFRASEDLDVLKISSPTECHFVLIMGEVVRDPLYFAGSLAAGSQEDLFKARERFLSGQMGSLAASF